VLYITAVLLVISTTIHTWEYYLFNKSSPDDHATLKWGWYFSANSVFIALLWSFMLYWIFDPDSTQNAYLVMFICACFIISSAPILSSFFPAYLLFAVTFSLPLIIIWITSDNSQYQLIGILELVELILMITFSYWINRTWRKSINLQFENLDLVESLQVQKNAADQANMAKSRFLAAASHDLRQPLHALTLFTAVLDEAVEQPKIRRVIGQINMSVKALENLFNALLDISQLDAGVLKPEKTNFDLQALFSKLANDYGPQARKKSVDLLCCSCPYTLYTDESLLEQILRNYISNAIRYTDAGAVEVSCDVDTTSIRINVTDTGVGIPEHEQQAIFDEFYQLDNPERDRSKGLGLGLAIVQRTAKLLGHTISVQSKPGEGSTFTITVARSTVDTASDALPPTDHMDNKQINKTRPMVLVIDDEASVRQGTQDLLELWGCKVLTATDKTEALAVLRQKNQMPDGIIADYRLREQQTGVEAIHAIHTEYNKDIPALIVTGDIATEHLLEVNKSGFQVLHKPVAPLKLRTFVHQIQMRQKNHIPQP